MRRRANKCILGQSSWQKYRLVSVCLQRSTIIKQDFTEREREKQLVTHSWMNNFPFFFYGDQLLFSGFTDYLPLTFLIHACCDFYQTTFGLKMSHLSTRNEAHGRGKSHKNDVVISSCCPLSSFITSSEFSFSSGHDAFSVPPNVRGGWWRRGPQRANPAGKSELSLSLCDSISRLCTHEWMPRHWVQSQRTSRGTHKVFSEDRTGWTVYALMEGNKKKRKKGELWGRVADKQIWDRIPARLRLTSRNN